MGGGSERDESTQREGEKKKINGSLVPDGSSEKVTTEWETEDSQPLNVSIEFTAGDKEMEVDSLEKKWLTIERNPKTTSKKRNTRKRTVLSIMRLFRYATTFDWLLMILGTLSAIAYGLVLPASMLVLAELTDSFVFHAASRVIVTTGDVYIPLRSALRTFERISTGTAISGGSGGSSNGYEDLCLGQRPDETSAGGGGGGGGEGDINYIILNFEDITGGEVDCSKQYYVEILPNIGVNVTITQVIQYCLYERAKCLDDEGFTDTINVLIGIFVSIAMVGMVLGSLEVWLFQTACERQARKIRLNYYGALLRQEIGWFDGRPTGELCFKLSDDIDKIQDGLGANLAILIQWVSTYFFGLAVGFYKSWILTLVMMGLSPFIIAPAAIFSKMAATFIRVELRHYASAGGVAEEVLAAIRTVIAFGGEYKESTQYDHHLKAASKVGVKRGLANGSSLFGVFFMLFASYAVAFWMGGWMASNGLGYGGVLIGVFFAVVVGSFYLGQSSSNFAALITAATTAESVFETIDRKSLIDSGSRKGLTPDDCNGSIQLKNVSFNYPTRPDVPVLRDFSVEIQPGQMLALIGSSGCGKTTVINLIQRFYDVNLGQVMVGGNDVRSLNVKWLRSQIGVVKQEAVLFNTTIAGNIRYGQLDATKEEIVQAAKLACAHEFIMKLPLQYNTVVGEFGAQLSGGQKQRIAIARALVRDPKILLLDEATSALDSQNEAVVQAALEQAQKGRTTIVIAHRLSTICNADVVAVVNDGEVVRLGKPSDILDLQDKTVEAEVQNMKLSEHTGTLKRQTLTLRKMTTRGTRARQLKWDEAECSPFSMKRVLSMNRKEWLLLIVGSVAAIVNGAEFPTFAIFFGAAFEVFVQPASLIFESVHPWAAGFLALAVVAGLSNFFKALCFSISGESLTTRVRSRTFRAMLRQEIGWFDDERHSTGALSNVLADDARHVQGAAGIRVGTILEIVTALVLAHVVGFAHSWLLTLVLMFVVPLYILAGWLHVKASTGFASLRRKAFKESNEIAVETVENIDTVASLGLEEKFYTDFGNKIKKPYRCGLATMLLYGPAQSVLLIGYIIAFRFGAYQVIQQPGDTTYAFFTDVYKVFAALMLASVNIGLATSLAPDYAKAKVSARKIFGILDRTSKIDGYSDEGSELLKVTGEIALRDVYFSYPSRPKVKVLQDLSISVPAGSMLALVGPSGCGKTTVVSLIERFYDPYLGTISLDGYDVKALNVRWLREQIGIVEQEPVLFDNTIAENIRYGANHKPVTNEEVVEAAIAANIHEFVISLPQGYETNVGAKGTQLSGGQKQRIAIARALVRDPKILLLDEATSALDSQNEKIVQEALDKAREGRTTIVIAHRLSTVHDADCIAVIHDGQVLERGSHSELMKMEGHYSKLMRLQGVAMSMAPQSNAVTNGSPCKAAEAGLQ